MSEITKPLLLNETVQALNSKIDTTNGYLQRIAAGVAPNLITKAITSNGTYTAASDNADGYSEVTVDVQGGGGATGPDIVRFIDYDGIILRTYTKDQFLALTEMPANPAHTGLTSQGWNYSLSDAKDYVTKYGSLDIGQMYITDDGKTRIHIHLEEGRLNPKLAIQLNGSCIIDWGDGSNTDTITGNNAEVSSVHTYSTGGDYIITLDVTGTFSFVGNGTIGSKLINHATTSDGNNNHVYQNSILEIYIGNNMTSIGDNAFNNCYLLISITIPEEVTFIGSYSFSNCFSLTSVTIPDTMILIGAYAFQYCCSLISVIIPKGVTSIATCIFQYCYSLISVIIPEGITYIENNAFVGCSALTSVIVPDGVTSIRSNAFQNCDSLTSVVIPGSVTSIGNIAFGGCSALTSVIISEGVNSIGSAFQNSYSLTSVVIPDTVTSIESNAFQNCYSLIAITISDTVTSIESGAFRNCYGLGFIKFENSTPPTVAASNAFNNVPTDCIIYVPAGSLSNYTTATNYPNPNTYTYVEY